MNVRVRSNTLADVYDAVALHPTRFEPAQRILRSPAPLTSHRSQVVDLQAKDVKAGPISNLDFYR